jgi:hypothetical protein
VTKVSDPAVTKTLALLRRWRDVNADCTFSEFRWMMEHSPLVHVSVERRGDGFFPDHSKLCHAVWATPQQL